MYHPKQSLRFLSCFSFAYSSTSYLAIHSLYTSSSSTKRSSPSLLEILQIALKVLSSDWVSSQLTNVLDRSLFRSLSNQNFNSDSSDEKEMILKQNLDVLVPKYIGTISFVLNFLEQIQRADWGAIVFDSWVDVISNRRPRLPKTRSCNTSSTTLKGHRKSRIQANSKFSPSYVSTLSIFSEILWSYYFLFKCISLSGK